MLSSEVNLPSPGANLPYPPDNLPSSEVNLPYPTFNLPSRGENLLYQKDDSVQKYSKYESNKPNISSTLPKLREIETQGKNDKIIKMRLIIEKSYVNKPTMILFEDNFQFWNQKFLGGLGIG